MLTDNELLKIELTALESFMPTYAGYEAQKMIREFRRDIKLLIQEIRELKETI